MRDNSSKTQDIGRKTNPANVSVITIVLCLTSN